MKTYGCGNKKLAINNIGPKNKYMDSLQATLQLGVHDQNQIIDTVTGPRERERAAADHSGRARTRTRVPAAPGGEAPAAAVAASNADTTVAVYQRAAGHSQRDRYLNFPCQDFNFSHKIVICIHLSLF
jgi:hypothetical protein